MAQCKNEAEVLAFLTPKLATIMQPVAEGMKEWNTKEIDRTVYRDGSPSEYFRTYQFRDIAWHESVESGEGEATAKLEYTPEFMEMGSNIPGFSDYGTHVSVVDGSDVRDSLADIIYNSGAGPIFGSGFWTAPRNAWKELIRIVSGSKMRTWINKGASNAGLKISWR